MFDIVSNQRNSVDMDKFDYLSRDCYNLAVRNTYDFSRYASFCDSFTNAI
jgi:deoxynucleoside triphosphate triphosphohydrolase SAMHD1